MLGAIAHVNITISPPNCHIGHQYLIFLGWQVSRLLGMSTHQEKIDAVDAMKPPRKVKELDMSLGFINYFVNCLPFFTRIITHLYRLTSKTPSGLGSHRSPRSIHTSSRVRANTGTSARRETIPPINRRELLQNRYCPSTSTTYRDPGSQWNSVIRPPC